MWAGQVQNFVRCVLFPKYNQYLLLGQLDYGEKEKGLFLIIVLLAKRAMIARANSK